VTRNFTEANIMVHSYLMYGYPTQTVQETIDSLEMVRQLFEVGVLQSGFWHQFALTAHSPVGLNPEEYGITPNYKNISFANNDIDFTDQTGIDHTPFSFGLKKSLFNFMHGIGFDLQLQEWFGFKIPETLIQPDFINNCLVQEVVFNIKPTAKILWIGTRPLINEFSKTKKGTTKDFLEFTFHDTLDTYSITTEKDKGLWLLEMLEQLTPQHKPQSFGYLKTDFEIHFKDFELFWYSKPVHTLRAHGLLVL